MENKSVLREKTYFSKEVTLTLKGIAVIMMLIHHLFCCFPEYVKKYHVSTLFLPLNKVMVLSQQSKLCVAVFVFLSAYGMTATLKKGGTATAVSQAKRRYLRLASSFLVIYICSILTCFLRADRLQVYMGEGRMKGILYMVMDAAGLASFFGSPTYNETWWYMSVAILLIFMFPIFAALYRKFGICIVVAAAMFPYMYGTTLFTSYLLAMFLGIALANSTLLTRLAALSSSRKILAFAGTALLFLITPVIRWKCGYMYWVDAAAALLAALALYLLIDLYQLRIFKPLAFLGRHSMNIFLVHTLIFEYYFTKFIYAPGNWILITALLTAVSLLISLAVEQIKKILFSKLQSVPI